MPPFRCSLRRSAPTRKQRKEGGEHERRLLRLSGYTHSATSTLHLVPTASVQPALLLHLLKESPYRMRSRRDGTSYQPTSSLCVIIYDSCGCSHSHHCDRFSVAGQLDKAAITSAGSMSTISSCSRLVRPLQDPGYPCLLAAHVSIPVTIRESLRDCGSGKSRQIADRIGIRHLPLSWLDRQPASALLPRLSGASEGVLGEGFGRLSVLVRVLDLDVYCGVYPHADGHGGGAVLSCSYVLAAASANKVA